MTTSNPVIGELVVKPIAGRNLLVKELFGKQDVFAEATLAPERKQTRVDRNGGQRPSWNDILRFEVRKNRPNKLLVKAICSSMTGDRKQIGQTEINLDKAFREQQYDGWFPLKDGEKLAGDIYLELTYYPEGSAAGAAPLSHSVTSPIVHNQPMKTNTTPLPATTPMAPPVPPLPKQERIQQVVGHSETVSFQNLGNASVVNSSFYPPNPPQQTHQQHQQIHQQQQTHQENVPTPQSVYPPHPLRHTNTPPIASVKPQVYPPTLSNYAASEVSANPLHPAPYPATHPAPYPPTKSTPSPNNGVYPPHSGSGSNYPPSHNLGGSVYPPTSKPPPSVYPPSNSYFPSNNSGSVYPPNISNSSSVYPPNASDSNSVYPPNNSSTSSVYPPINSQSSFPPNSGNSVYPPVNSYAHSNISHSHSSTVYPPSDSVYPPSSSKNPVYPPTNSQHYLPSSIGPPSVYPPIHSSNVGGFALGNAPTVTYPPRNGSTSGPSANYSVPQVPTSQQGYPPRPAANSVYPPISPPAQHHQGYAASAVGSNSGVYPPQYSNPPPTQSFTQPYPPSFGGGNGPPPPPLPSRPGGFVFGPATTPPHSTQSGGFSFSRGNEKSSK